MTKQLDTIYQNLPPFFRDFIDTTDCTRKTKTERKRAILLCADAVQLANYYRNPVRLWLGVRQSEKPKLPFYQKYTAKNWPTLVERATLYLKHGMHRRRSPWVRRLVNRFARR